MSYKLTCFLTCSCFSSEHSIEVCCVYLPGQNRLSVARGHFLHVAVPIWSHMGPSSCRFGLHKRGPLVLLVWGTVHRSSLVEQSIIGADSVELLPGVCDRAGPRQVQLGTGSSPYSRSVPGEGAEQTAVLLAIGGPLHTWRSCWPREVCSLTFWCVRHWTATYRGWCDGDGTRCRSWGGKDRLF